MLHTATEDTRSDDALTHNEAAAVLASAPHGYSCAVANAASSLYRKGKKNEIDNMNSRDMNKKNGGSYSSNNSSDSSDVNRAAVQASASTSHTTPPSLCCPDRSDMYTDGPGVSAHERDAQHRDYRCDGDTCVSSNMRSHRGDVGRASSVSASQCSVGEASSSAQSSACRHHHLRKKYVTTTVTTVTTTSILLPRMQDCVYRTTTQHAPPPQQQQQQQHRHAHAIPCTIDGTAPLQLHDERPMPLQSPQHASATHSPATHSTTCVPHACIGERNRGHCDVVACVAHGNVDDDEQKSNNNDHNRDKGHGNDVQQSEQQRRRHSDEKIEKHTVSCSEATPPPPQQQQQQAQQQWNFTQHSARTVERSVCHDAPPTLAELGIAEVVDNGDNASVHNVAATNAVAASACDTEGAAMITRHAVQLRERFVNATLASCRPVLLHETRDEVEGGGWDEM